MRRTGHIIRVSVPSMPMAHRDVTDRGLVPACSQPSPRPRLTTAQFLTRHMPWERAMLPSALKGVRPASCSQHARVQKRRGAAYARLGCERETGVAMFSRARKGREAQGDRGGAAACEGWTIETAPATTAHRSASVRVYVHLTLRIFCTRWGKKTSRLRGRMCGILGGPSSRA